MAEKRFEETFHRTLPSEMYNDLQSASFHATERRSDPNYEFDIIPEENAPPVPSPRTKQQVYGQMITPKSYDGKSNPRIWLNHYETVAEANLWSDDLKLRRVVGSLDGAAQNWYMNLRMVRQFENWAKFKEALINRFTNTMDDIMLTENIIRTRQKNNDFDSYWEQKIGLIRLTNPNMNEKELMHHMFNGLNKELRTQVLDKLIVRKCDTAAELQLLVKELVDIQNYQQEETYNPQKKGKYHSNAIVEVQKPWTPENKWTPNKNNDQKYQRLEKEIKNQSSEIIKEIKDLLTKGKRTYNNKSKIERSEERKSPDRKNVECFSCKRKGHFSNECPNKEIECYACHQKGHFANNCNKKDIECFICHEKGHISKNCSLERKPSKEKIRCYKCNEMGHYANECSSAQDKEEAAPKENPNKKDTNRGNANRRN